MRYCILASGSRGNSLFIESVHGRFLVDVGLSARKIETRLKERDIDPKTIDAIVLTHSHGDHVRGVGVFAHRHKLPIYGHPETLDSITHLLKPAQEVIPWSAPFTVKDVRFTPFELPHDCEPTVGYLVREGARTLAVCTDLGYVPPSLTGLLRQAQAMVLESNHDPDMLMNGPYPWHLKDRIAGRRGHLSNHNAGELLKEILHPAIRHVVLGHLSEENNTAVLARDTVLEHIGVQFAPIVDVVEQQTVSALYDL